MARRFSASSLAPAGGLNTRPLSVESSRAKKRIGRLLQGSQIWVLDNDRHEDSCTSVGATLASPRQGRTNCTLSVWREGLLHFSLWRGSRLLSWVISLIPGTEGFVGQVSEGRIRKSTSPDCKDTPEQGWVVYLLCGASACPHPQLPVGSNVPEYWLQGGWLSESWTGKQP